MRRGMADPLGPHGGALFVFPEMMQRRGS